MFSDPILLDNGNLLVPMTAESEYGDIGDGMVEIDNTHPDFTEWMKFLPNITKEDIPTVTIDNVENDDWMKSLPKYKSEVAIHQELARKWKRNHK